MFLMNAVSLYDTNWFSNCVISPCLIIQSSQNKTLFISINRLCVQSFWKKECRPTMCLIDTLKISMCQWDFQDFKRFIVIVTEKNKIMKRASFHKTASHTRSHWPSMAAVLNLDTFYLYLYGILKRIKLDWYKKQISMRCYQ